MICKMFTINGKAPTIGNTALTGSAIDNPGVVLEYFNPRNYTPHYDGFSVRVAKTGTTATIDYENMCYYSTAKYDNPDPSQLNKAFFIPMSSLTYTTDPNYNFYCLKSVNIPPVSAIRNGYGYVFPCDEADYDHAGAYVIPTAEYAGQNLYVYIWLPDVLQSPENKDQVGLDCTVLKANTEKIGFNIHKCDMPGLNQYCFNQSYIKEIIDCHLPSGHQYLGYGDVISTEYLSPIELISASDIEQYQPVQSVNSAYDSKLAGGFQSIQYAENCDLIGATNGYTRLTAISAKNCNISAAKWYSANGCNITVNDFISTGYGDSGISAFNSTINWTNDNSIGAYSYFTDCDITQTPTWCNRWTLQNCNVSSTRTNPTSPAGMGTELTAKNTYWHYGTSAWYAENYPTTPFVPL